MARRRWTAAACGATTSNPEVENLFLMERNSSTGPAADPAPVGEADHVSKSFGETRALVDVSLDVRPGECHGLVGRNGAGKSTLVSLLTGLSRPDRGSIRLAGQHAPGLADPRPGARFDARLGIRSRRRPGGWTVDGRAAADRRDRAGPVVRRPPSDPR